LDILLTHAYFLFEDAAERRIMRPYPPLGLLYVSSHLRSRGFDVAVLDSTFRSRAEFEAELVRLKPPIVGIYATLMTRQNAIEIISMAKRTGARVIMGGPEPVNYAEEYLDCGADVIVAGEGERTLEELIPILSSQDAAALTDVPGTISRDERGLVRHGPPRANIEDLDAQPYPDRAAIDLERYLATWQEHHGVRSVSLITARGCPYTCTWCSHSVYGFSHRRRSPENVADELQSLIERYSPNQAWYADDVFTINKRWLVRYAAELESRNIRMPFEIITREDRLDEPTIDVLASMGCYRIWIGAESGSQKILDAMARRTDASRTRDLIRSVQRRGIRAGTFIMVGYEGESWSDIDETRRHIIEAMPDDLLTTLSYPIKGTPYYKAVEDRIIAARPWAESSDRELTVAGRHSRAFYRHTQRWLASELARARETKKQNVDYASLLKATLRSVSSRAGMYFTRLQVEQS